MPYIETESRYENTAMLEIRNKDNVLMGYDIAPVEGYVLHNSALDQYEYDLETNEQKDNIFMGYDIDSVEGYVSHNSALDQYEYDLETNKQKKLISHGYSYGSCSVNPDYDFNENPEEIYAIKEDDVGEDGIIY